jgi:hypothetical protein
MGRNTVAFFKVMAVHAFLYEPGCRTITKEQENRSEEVVLEVSVGSCGLKKKRPYVKPGNQTRAKYV